MSLRFLRLKMPKEIERLEELGKFHEAERLIKELLKRSQIRLEERDRFYFELMRLQVLRGEYSLNFNEALKKFKEEVPDITLDEFNELIRKGKIDCREIDGKTMFFKNFIYNFFKLNKDWKKRRVKREDPLREKARKALFKHQDRIVELTKDVGGYVSCAKFRIRHTIRIKASALSRGEEVKVWIPIPRRCELHPEVKIMAYHPVKPYIAHEEIPQRTAYFEADYNGKGDMTFWIEYEYVARAYYRRVKTDYVRPYDEESDIYIRYTSEQEPHIAFTPHLEELAREIVKGEDNPYLKAKRIFDWIVKNITYNLPYEYIVYDNIPEYVVRDRRGDCGMQALLFITLCRIAGIPARWQSGWYMNPIKPGMHDWGQFYVEPYGWMYADPSFAGSMPRERKDFYFGNIDGFRMAANNDIATQFDPPKRYFRSDPVDNQRGEVETEAGNLYYDKWDFEVEIHRYDMM